MKTGCRKRRLNMAFVFGRPFVKQFALCYRSVFCLSGLSVTLVYCGQTVDGIQMKLRVQVGLGPGHIVFDGDPSPPPQMGVRAPQFSAYVYCGQSVGWIKMAVGMEVCLGPGDCVRWGPSSLPRKGGGGRASPIFGPFYCGQTAGWIKMPVVRK